MLGEEKAAALRGAMIELRETYPHPSHWAPFTLIGKDFPDLNSGNFFLSPYIFSAGSYPYELVAAVGGEVAIRARHGNRVRGNGMRHYSLEKWVDFVRNVIREAEETEMQNHLTAVAQSARRNWVCGSVYNNLRGANQSTHHRGCRTHS